MKLLLIRHGESARNRGYDVSNEDNNLTSEGVEQVVELAKKLAREKIDAIYCSTTPRCQQTLEEILRIRRDQMPIHLSRSIGPKLRKESYEQLKRRIEGFIDDLKYDHGNEETVLIISHQLPLAMVVWVIEKKERRFENAELFQIIL